MEFGINPKNRGATPIAWWGARTIYNAFDYTFDILWDRKQTIGENAEPLWKWLDEWGLPTLRKELERLHVQANDEEDIVVESHGYKLVANPNRSYGYLYIGAWPIGEMVMPPDAPKKKEVKRERATASKRKTVRRTL